MNFKIENVIINVLCIIILTGLAGYLFFRWKYIPDYIPSHFDFKGNADNVSKKYILLVFDVINIFLFSVLSVLEFLPSVWKMAVSDNSEKLDTFKLRTIRMMMVNKLFIVLWFGYMIISMSLSLGINIFSFIIFIVAVTVNIGYYFLKIFKMK